MTRRMKAYQEKLDLLRNECLNKDIDQLYYNNICKVIISLEKEIEIAKNKGGR